ncbi:MAG: sugar ABC transporter ATP-binding protein [Microbacteriaceae bacterium]|nr:MAG: sugar ABC transporter ATP-binding protein [Microbacteriaceae bacterium]
MAKETAPALRITRLNKTYPGVHALRDVSLTIERGVVHAIVGENGAGKSTLMKVVAGAIAQDGGSIDVFGRPLEPGSPTRSSDAGVATIYQELTIVPEMSVLANVLLGHLPSTWGVIHRTVALEQFYRVAAVVGFTHPAAQRAGELSTAAQQLVEIMRALARGGRVVIMDEPTASLGPADVRRLHRVIDTLRTAGHSIVYVSHDLDDVLEISDTVTVMREGAIVTTKSASEWTKSSLIYAMLGGVSLETPVAAATTGTGNTPLLEVLGLRAPGVSIDRIAIRPGEIVGLAGLVGSGRSRLLRALAGADVVDSGQLLVAGRRITWPRTPHAALAAGICFAPEDRKLQALVLERTSAWNVALGQFGVAGIMRPVRESVLRSWARAFTQLVGLPEHRLANPAGTLSGGNQQKLIVSRLLSRRAKVVLLDEPTRGIDIGAKAQIFQAARRIVDGGRAIIWASSDLTEIVEHSDRIVVVANGRVVGELPRGSTVHDILTLSYAASGTGESAAA